MKVSVVIPTYNSSAFIRATIDSVLCQTRWPNEILVIDDGSQDDTLEILKSYGSRITVFQQANRGVAAARNELCKQAKGDLIAFLDHDDIWHPKYLEIQSECAAKYPEATAFFTNHVVFQGFGTNQWNVEEIDREFEAQVIDPESFLLRYHSSTGTFYSMSFCCIPKWIVAKLKHAAFNETLSGADDFYLCNLLPLYGPVVLTPAALGAYRVTAGAQSTNQLKSYRKSIEAFELLGVQYRASASHKLLRGFRVSFAGRRRRYAKTLMGSGRVSEARDQFRNSILESWNLVSFAKSMGLLMLSYLPGPMQPRWPSSLRPSS